MKAYLKMETEISEPQNFTTAADYLSEIYADPDLKADFREAAENLAEHMGQTLALQKPLAPKIREVKDHLAEGLRARFYMGVIRGFETLLKQPIGQVERQRLQSIQTSISRDLRILSA